MRRVVTIDGPAGAGKSTVARKLAERLGWRLLDTGAMYRAVTLAAVRAGTDLESDLALGELAGGVEVRLPPGQVLLDGQDVSNDIRTSEISRKSKFLADSPSVRRRLRDWQQAFATETDTVTEGRDQGTVVFPRADCKFFLTASLDERAKRRHAEYMTRGETIGLDEVRTEMAERDRRDAARTLAPMTPAGDALVVDTTGMDLEGLVALIEQAVLDPSAGSWRGGLAGGRERRLAPSYLSGLWTAWSAAEGRLVAVSRTSEGAAFAAETSSVTGAVLQKVPNLDGLVVGPSA
jgi:cytidylate kinase